MLDTADSGIGNCAVNKLCRQSYCGFAAPEPRSSSPKQPKRQRAQQQRQQEACKSCNETSSSEQSMLTPAQKHFHCARPATTLALFMIVLAPPTNAAAATSMALSSIPSQSAFFWTTVSGVIFYLRHPVLNHIQDQPPQKTPPRQGHARED